MMSEPTVEPAPPTEKDIQEQVQVRMDKARDMRAGGENPYRNGMTPESLAADLHAEFGERSTEELESAAVTKSIGGRVMAIRNFGKAAFVKINDRSGRIQLFVQKNVLGEEAFKKFKKLDVGDVVFSSGTMFKTKTGELSIKSTEVVLLTKCLRPLPEKFHGLTDTELRYRQRYLDLLMSEESKEVFRKRSEIVAIVREYFISHGFLEVETPMMHPLVGGAVARPFITHHNTLKMDLYLRIAPELYLKRLVVGGLDRVFEINRNFRNEGISIQHNPEFTMLEFYQAYATFEDHMDHTEKLVGLIATKVSGGHQVKYQDTTLDFSPGWKRVSVEDSIIEFSDFKDSGKLRDRDALVAYLDKKEIHYEKRDPVGKLQMTIFDNEVEHRLIQPTFVTHYPVDVSPLSRANDKDSFIADRFEFFIFGREIGNGFSELNDPVDQRERFQKQVDAKAAGDDEACDMDEDYIRALEYGLPPTAGEGIGIDRLVMLFTDSKSIRDVILFPQLKSLS